MGQFALLLLGLVESCIVHMLIRANKFDLANRIDRIGRFAIPFGVYPVFIASMVLFGYMYDQLAIAVFCGGNLFIIVYLIVLLKYGSLQAMRKRRAIVAKMKTRDLGREESAPLIEEAFELFDAGTPKTRVEPTCPLLPCSMRRVPCCSGSLGEMRIPLAGASAQRRIARAPFVRCMRAAPPPRWLLCAQTTAVPSTRASSTR
jgi:hypothetical protein